MTAEKKPTFVVWRCDCGCGVVKKVDVSKYTKRVQKGLQKDFNIKPESASHRCPVCNQNCKSQNGAGTQAALQINKLGEAHQNVLRVLAMIDHASVEELLLHLHVNCDLKTTGNTIHSRISELRAWRLIEAIEVAESTHETGVEYDASPIVHYRLNRKRAELIEQYEWQTWPLVALDSGVPYEQLVLPQNWQSFCETAYDSTRFGETDG